MGYTKHYYDPLWSTVTHYDPKKFLIWPTMTQKISIMIHYDPKNF